MTNAEIKGILSREMENKKVYSAEWDGRCGFCPHPILEGDSFVFMGNKEKVCDNCRKEIIEHLESL